MYTPYYKIAALNQIVTTCLQVCQELGDTLKIEFRRFYHVSSSIVHCINDKCPIEKEVHCINDQYSKLTMQNFVMNTKYSPPF